MVRIVCIGSGSSGNGYVLECTSEDGFVDRLIIEAGLQFKKVQEALKFDLRNISGCLISHEHQDHAGFASQVAQRGIIIYGTRGTIEKMHVGAGAGLVAMKKKEVYEIGSFKVLAFETEHDAAEPCGFLIECADGNRVLFATDTYYVKYMFPDVSIYMIECNYDEKLLQRNIREGIVNPKVGERVRTSHMSLRQCISTLQANNLHRTKAILLIHLSGDNSRADDFKRKIEEATGKPVYIATKGMTQTFF